MSVSVLTFGCRLNARESELIGQARPSSGDDRPTLVVNTCAVTAEAERQARQAIRAAHRREPATRIVVTGCAAEIAPAGWAAMPGVERVVPNARKLDAAAHGLAPGMAAGDRGARTRALVQVQQGCDQRCTFCVIPFGRGPSRSVALPAIVAEVRAAVERGVAEVVLTGVDVASYGRDLPDRPTLGAVVRHLLDAVPALPRLRLSSLDPAAIDAALWHAIAEEPRLMPHLHLSMQHGDDLVLKRMRRRHDAAGLRRLVARAVAVRPDIAFGADVIAGFPTETDAAFARCLELIEELGVAHLHVFPYSPRPGTPAARMPEVAGPVVRARAARLRETGAALRARFLASRSGRTEAVLLERADEGHTAQHARLRLVSGAGERGQVLRARVVGVAEGLLLGEAA